MLGVWGGTNDCAVGVLDCAQPAFTRLVLIARAARAAGWKVVAVTMIARASWFLDDQHQQQFPLSQAALNSLLLGSAEFDAVADPSVVLNDPTNYTYYYDGTHLWPKGYQVVANLVAQAIRSLP